MYITKKSPRLQSYINDTVKTKLEVCNIDNLNNINSNRDPGTVFMKILYSYRF